MRLILIVLSLVAVSVTANSAKADRRVAFVAGNGAYKNLPRLPNAPISAKAMAGLLQSVGFEIVQGVDLSRDALTQRLLEFGKKAEGADLAVFYYSGSSISVNSVAYLLPIDADIKSEVDVKLGAGIDINLALDQTMIDAKVKLVFIDTSRDNSFVAKVRSNPPLRAVSGQSGLVETKAGEGSLLAFATGPGQVAWDGPEGSIRPFTRALIAHIATPGVEIQEAMTQVRAQVQEETNKGQLPWARSNLIHSIYLEPTGSPANPPASTK